MSGNKNGTAVKKAKTLSDVTNNIDNITKGFSVYGDLRPEQVFHSELKELYENGSLPIYEVKKYRTPMLMNQMKDELKYCLSDILSPPNGERLLADIIFLLKKQIVFGEECQIDTACIKLLKNSDQKYEMSLVLNADFFFGECATREQKIGVLYHEIYHVLFKHLGIRRADKQTALWNIAQDLAINSNVCPYQRSGDDTNPIWTVDLSRFPPYVSAEVQLDILDPNKDPIAIEEKVRESFRLLDEKSGHQTSEEEIERAVANSMKFTPRVAVTGGCFPLVGVFKDIPPKLSAEEYYEILTDPNGPVKWCDIQAIYQLIMSEHDWFSEIDVDNLGELPQDATEEFRRFYDNVKLKVREHLQRRAGRGMSEIDKMLSDLYVAKPNWASILSRHIATARKNIFQSWARRNRRGVKGIPAVLQDFAHNVRIYIDQSGSMSDENVATMYARIKPLIKSASVVVYHFDDGVDDESRHSVKNIGDLRPIRTRCGGTNFNSVFDHFNESKNERVDVVIIMTDMGDAPPLQSDNKVVFVYGEDMGLPTDVDKPFRDRGHKVIELPS